MKKAQILFALLLAATVLLSGCASGGSMLAQHVTDVQLAQPNFKIVATDLQGRAQAGYIFGISYSMGQFTNALAIARVSGSEHLHQTALKNVWLQYAEKHGPIEGKKLALVNIRYDADALNLLLYTQVDLIIHADVVEFY